MAETLLDYRAALRDVPTVPWRGVVLEASGAALLSDGPAARIGEAIEVRTASGATHEGEVIGFKRERAVIMLSDGGGAGRDGGGIRYGDEVVALGHEPYLRVGNQLLGRVVDARAEAIDGRSVDPHGWHGAA